MQISHIPFRINVVTEIMTQALETILSGWEASNSRAFREEQRDWRRDDLSWRALRRAHDDAKVSQRYAVLCAGWARGNVCNNKPFAGTRCCGQFAGSSFGNGAHTI